MLFDQGLTDERAALDELGVGDRVVDGLGLFAETGQTPLLEQAEMLRDVVHGDADLGGEVADTALALAQRVEDGQAVLVGERLASSACAWKTGWRSGGGCQAVDMLRGGSAAVSRLRRTIEKTGTSGCDGQAGGSVERDRGRIKGLRGRRSGATPHVGDDSGPLRRKLPSVWRTSCERHSGQRFCLSLIALSVETVNACLHCWQTSLIVANVPSSIGCGYPRGYHSLTGR